MPQGFARAAGIVLAVQLSTVGLAFQVSEGPLEVIPRTAARAAGTPVVRVNSSLVLIPVHVTTAGGASVTNLRKEDFRVFEDGVEQTITHFSQDDAPVSAGVLLDVSGSMRNKMAKASEAASQFFKYANPEDEFFLVEFNGRARLTVPFTRDWAGIAAQIADAKPSGMTAMLDGIHVAIAQMKHAKHTRKALVVVSDGGDNFSRRSLRELKSRLIEADVQVYSLGIFDHDFQIRHTPEERNGPTLLEQVALDSGGRTYTVSLDALPGIGAQMARELRDQYLLGYSSATATADGKYHRVDLKLAAPYAQSDMRTYYRQGYYSPGQ